MSFIKLLSSINPLFSNRLLFNQLLSNPSLAMHSLTKLSKPFRLLMVVVMCVGLLSACGRFKFPGVFKIDVAQGNIIEAAQVAQLKVGMTQNQVIYLLGSPMIQDPFQQPLEQQRWDYVYYLSQGGNQPVTHQVTLYFSDKRLARIEGSAPVRIDTQEQRKSRANKDPLKDLAPI